MVLYWYEGGIIYSHLPCLWFGGACPPWVEMIHTHTNQDSDNLCLTIKFQFSMTRKTLKDLIDTGIREIYIKSYGYVELLRDFVVVMQKSVLLLLKLILKM